MRGRPFSRSYGAILPSSLTMVDPIASVCSTPPAYVNRLARGAEGGRSEEAQATVYQKHRTLQKAQADV